MGFKVGLVSNSYWATTDQDAQICLESIAGLIQDLTVSSDLYHYSEKLSQEAQSAVKAAEQLGVPIYGIITVAQPEEIDAATAVGQLPQDESKVLYHGRAAEKLAPRADKFTWTQFTECPYEDLRDPGRVHVDPYGYLHICQGITIGNLFHTTLREIIDSYDPNNHPISGPLLEGGPVELVNRYGLAHEGKYADACELCYKARLTLREQFPEILAPDQMYGVFDS